VRQVSNAVLTQLTPVREIQRLESLPLLLCNKILGSDHGELKAERYKR